jgi:16S rRNA processing protein RimM
VAETARRVCVGLVTAAHGIRGAVRVKSFTAIPEDIARYGPVEDESGRRSFTIEIIGTAKGVLIARLPGVEDRDRAEALRGLRFYLPRAALPAPQAEEYYHADLIGLGAVLPDGTPVGRVRAIHDFGAGDVIEIERQAAPPALIPFTRAAVPIVDLAAGKLVIDPPPGLLEAVAEDAPFETPPLILRSRRKAASRKGSSSGAGGEAR